MSPMTDCYGELKSIRNIYIHTHTRTHTDTFFESADKFNIKWPEYEFK